MKGIYWDEASQGTKFEYRDVPAELMDQAKEWREKLVEVATESNEELMDKYLGEGDLPEEDIKKALRQRTIAAVSYTHLPEIITRNEKRMLQEAVDSLLDNGRRGKARCV